MWGLKNLIKSLLPEEESELTREDRLQMSRGMKIILDRYGFDVKPEMVNRSIIEMACGLYGCDHCLNKNAGSLRRTGHFLKKVSGIDPQDWDLLKLATALKIICHPEATSMPSNSQEIVVGRKGTELLTNEAGEVTSHLQGMLNRTVRLLEAGIKPVFVFDGEPPDMKKKELAKRSLKRDAAAKDLNIAMEVGDEDSVEKFSKRTVKVTKKHNDDCKRLLRLMGVPVVEAPGEAEAQCAALCENHQVYAVASEDMDLLTFGARRFLRHLTDLSFKKSPVTEFEVSKVLEELGLTMDQFIDLCILSGCDYCENIKGIGGQRALKLIRQHGCIEEVLQNLNLKRYSVPEDWPYQEVRTLFKEPNVCREIPDFLWTSPDSEGLMNFLSTENSFSPDRVAKAVEKIKAARDRFSPGRLKLLTPVTNLPGSVTEKEPKCILGSPGQSLKVRSAPQVCKGSSSNFRYGNSKPFMLGRQSGFHGIAYAFI